MCKLPRNLSQQFQKSSMAFIGLLAVLVCASVQGRSQSTQGAIVGSVKDPGGAVVVNAAVTLTNTDEGASRTTKSNSTGDYRFVDVKAGHYSVEVVIPGFEKWSATG